MNTRLWCGRLIVGLGIFILLGCSQPGRAGRPGDGGVSIEKPPVKGDFRQLMQNALPPPSPQDDARFIDDQLADLHLKSMDVDNEINKLRFVQERLGQEKGRLSARQGEIIRQQNQNENQSRNRHFEEMMRTREELKRRTEELSPKVNENPGLAPELDKLHQQISGLDNEIKQEQMRRESEEKDRFKNRVEELNRNLEDLKRRRQELDRRVAEMKRNLEKEYQEINRQESDIQNELAKTQGGRQKQGKEDRQAIGEKLRRYRDELAGQMKELQHKLGQNENKLKSGDIPPDQRKNLQSENDGLRQKLESCKQELNAVNQQIAQTEKNEGKQKGRQRENRAQEIRENLDKMQMRRSEMDKQPENYKKEYIREYQEIDEKTKRLKQELQELERE
ncbi:MAG: hypothetical protein V1701_03255 [Planctomycetota bacterium]